jgi:hypothetical protein
MCKPYLDYQKINPNTQLMVIADCIQSCNDAIVTNYHFSIFIEWNFNLNDPQKKWIECISSGTSKLLTY